MISLLIFKYFNLFFKFRQSCNDPWKNPFKTEQSITK